MFNKSEIMTRAWARTKALGSDIAEVMGGVKVLFAQMLREAWADAKAAKPVMLTKKQATHQLMLQDNKTRWTAADYWRCDALNLAVRAA